jgi:hypothetical protein
MPSPFNIWLPGVAGTSGLDPQLGLGEVALGLAREDFAGHFVATLDEQATLQKATVLEVKGLGHEDTSK